VVAQDLILMHHSLVNTLRHRIGVLALANNATCHSTLDPSLILLVRCKLCCQRLMRRGRLRVVLNALIRLPLLNPYALQVCHLISSLSPRPPRLLLLNCEALLHLAKVCTDSLHRSPPLSALLLIIASLIRVLAGCRTPFLSDPLVSRGYLDLLSHSLNTVLLRLAHIAIVARGILLKHKQVLSQSMKVLEE
jgi:hypothetical protein